MFAKRKPPYFTKKSVDLMWRWQDKYVDICTVLAHEYNHRNKEHCQMTIYVSKWEQIQIITSFMNLLPCLTDFLLMTGFNKPHISLVKYRKEGQYIWGFPSKNKLVELFIPIMITSEKLMV